MRSSASIRRGWAHSKRRWTPSVRRSKSWSRRCAYSNPIPSWTAVLRGRSEALRQLAEVAQYFQRTEPHSSVAYLVQRAIKWGHMPLEVWLEDVIKDGATLGHLKETLGIGTEIGRAHV